jgi:hypothetical protein
MCCNKWPEKAINNKLLTIYKLIKTKRAVACYYLKGARLWVVEWVEILDPYSQFVSNACVAVVYPLSLLPPRIHSDQIWSKSTKNIHSGQICSETIKNIHSGQMHSESTKNIQSDQIWSKSTKNIHSGQICSKSIKNIHSGQMRSKSTKNIHSGQMRSESIKTSIVVKCAWNRKKACQLS